MAGLNIAEWTPEQVSEWLSGLGPSVAQYVPSLQARGLDGVKLLTLRCDDLEYLGIHVIGHQELLLEAVEHLRNFHYELSRECIQQLALRVSVAAASLARALRQHSDARLETQTLADVARTVGAVKPLACWLDGGALGARRAELLRLALEAATCAMRDRWSQQPARAVAAAAATTAAAAADIVRHAADPAVLAPAALHAAALRPRRGELGFDVRRSHGGHLQLANIRFGSPAHASGAVLAGDEVVQVGARCVLGWGARAVEAACAEAGARGELTLRLRRRAPRAPPALTRRARRAPPEPAPDEPASDDSALSPPASPSLPPRAFPPGPRAQLARRHSVGGGSPAARRASLALDQDGFGTKLCPAAVAAAARGARAGGRRAVRARQGRVVRRRAAAAAGRRRAPRAPGQGALHARLRAAARGAARRAQGGADPRLQAEQLADRRGHAAPARARGAGARAARAALRLPARAAAAAARAAAGRVADLAAAAPGAARRAAQRGAGAARGPRARRARRGARHRAVAGQRRARHLPQLQGAQPQEAELRAGQAARRAVRRGGGARRGGRGVAARARGRGRALGAARAAAGARRAVRLPRRRRVARRAHDAAARRRRGRGARGALARARLQGVPHRHRLLLRLRRARRHAGLDPAHPPRHAAAAGGRRGALLGDRLLGRRLRRRRALRLAEEAGARGGRRLLHQPGPQVPAVLLAPQGQGRRQGEGQAAGAHGALPQLPPRAARGQRQLARLAGRGAASRAPHPEADQLHPRVEPQPAGLREERLRGPAGAAAARAARGAREPRRARDAGAVHAGQAAGGAAPAERQPRAAGRRARPPAAPPPRPHRARRHLRRGGRRRQARVRGGQGRLREARVPRRAAGGRRGRARAARALARLAAPQPPRAQRRRRGVARHVGRRAVPAPAVPAHLPAGELLAGAPAPPAPALGPPRRPQIVIACH